MIRRLKIRGSSVEFADTGGLIGAQFICSQDHKTSLVLEPFEIDEAAALQRKQNTIDQDPKLFREYPDVVKAWTKWIRLSIPHVCPICAETTTESDIEIETQDKTA